MSMIKTGVIGTGYLGSFHVQKYAQLNNSNLIGVYDIDYKKAQKIADQYGIVCFKNHEELISQVDAVSIATPTSNHYAVARNCLEANVHILIEKPMCETLVEAKALINIADKKSLIMQVGFLERFNPALDTIKKMVNEPIFIESHRLSSFTHRSTDINVLMDIMIHDLDLLLFIMRSKPIEISAMGTSVLSNSIDIAQSRIVFENGCVANITASRISDKKERKMRIFQSHDYISADFSIPSVRYFNKKIMPKGQFNKIEQQSYHYSEHSDALKAEIMHFLDCITNKKIPLADGISGYNSLCLALKIGQIISEKKVNAVRV